jgi:hypothetical protein
MRRQPGRCAARCRRRAARARAPRRRSRPARPRPARSAWPSWPPPAASGPSPRRTCARHRRRLRRAADARAPVSAHTRPRGAALARPRFGRHHGISRWRASQRAAQARALKSEPQRGARPASLTVSSGECGGHACLPNSTLDHPRVAGGRSLEAKPCPLLQMASAAFAAPGRSRVATWVEAVRPGPRASSEVQPYRAGPPHATPHRGTLAAQASGIGLRYTLFTLSGPHVSTRSSCTPGTPPPQAKSWPPTAAAARLPRAADMGATGSHSAPSCAVSILRAARSAPRSM